MLKPTNKPNATNPQSERLTPCIECGIPTPYKTTNRVCCAACSEARRRESYRKAAEVQRRKKGIEQVKGVEAACDKCAASFIRRTRTHRFCDDCSPRHLPSDADPVCLDCKRPIAREGERGPPKKRCDACRLAVRKAARQKAAGVTVPLGTPMACEKCGVEVIRTGGHKRFCDPCGTELRRQSDLRRYYLRQGREPIPGVGSLTVCASCPTEFIRTRSDHTYCDQCLHDRRTSYVNRVREAQRRAENVPIRRGVVIKCDHCGTDFVRQDTKQKFCRKCKNQKQIRNIRRRLDTDAVFAFNHSVSASIRSSLNGFKAGRRWESIVGYTVHDLRRHLERQFSRKMTWENRGSYWELEHIRPISSFTITGPDCQAFRDCWSLLNLRPWPKDLNRAKRDKRLFLL